MRTSKETRRKREDFLDFFSDNFIFLLAVMLIALILSFRNEEQSRGIVLMFPAGLFWYLFLGVIRKIRSR